MKQYIFGLAIAAAVLVTPLTASAQSLTSAQVSAIIGVLQSFGVAQSVLDSVYNDLVPRAQTVTPVVSTPVTPTFGSTAPAVDDFEAYRIAYIADGSFIGYTVPFINYWGSKQLDASSVVVKSNGVVSTSTVSVLATGPQGGNCINLFDRDNYWLGKKCGGYYVHFAFTPALASGNYTITLTDADSNTVSQDFTVN